MPPDERPEADLIRTRHMRDAVKEALSFTKGKKRTALDKDRLLTLALTKELEILGEAASRVTPGFQRLHPSIPWSAIIGMRNRLTHGYFDIDLDIVWTTVTRDLPPLHKALNAILKNYP
jgi:uncharacterized protein with HEPN domain